ncbi:MAG: hypothetical protein QXD34_03695 [Candidatus Bathyarchaeia archaeon]|nr:hypothetical protein [Candidatus Bathyarchaeota archaeon]
MSARKRRERNFIDELFGGSLFSEMENFFKDLKGDTFSSGYSIRVTQTPQGIKVKAKVGKDVDVNALRKQLEKQYPKAQIEIEGGRQEPLIREISTRQVKEDEET